MQSSSSSSNVARFIQKYPFLQPKSNSGFYLFDKSLKGHSSTVTSIAISKDTFFSGSDDNTIKMWDMSGKCLQTLKGHTSTVYSIAISSDNQKIVSGSWDKTIKIWDMNGKCLQTLQGHNHYVMSVVISNDNQRIVSSSWDKTIKIWDMKGNCLQTLHGHTDTINSVAISSDNQRIISGSQDKTIKIWDISGKCLQTLEGHTDSVNSIALSLDTIVSGSHDKLIKIWSMNGKCLQTIEGHTAPVYSVCISSDNQRIVSGAYKTIKIWDMHGKCIQTLDRHSSDVNSIAISTNNQRIVSGSVDKTIKIWELSGECLQILKGSSSSVSSIAISSDNQTIVSGSYDKTIKIWDLNGTCLHTLEGHTLDVFSVAISSDNQRIVSGSGDKTIKLWDMNGKCLQTFQGHSGYVTSVAITSDNKRIVSGSYDKTIKIWDINGKCLLQTFQGHTSSVSSIVISADNKRIVSGAYDKTIKIWDMNGKCLQTLQGHASLVHSVAITSDNQRIVSGAYDKTIKIWDLNGKCLQTLKGHTSYILAVAISSDNQRIVSGSVDKTIKVWDMDGNCLQTFGGHTFTVYSVAITSDNQHIVSGSGDKTIRIWDMYGKSLLLKHQSPVESVIFAKFNPELMASIDSNKLGCVWNLKTGKLIDSKNLQIPLESYLDSFNKSLSENIQQFNIQLSLLNQLVQKSDKATQNVSEIINNSIPSSIIQLIEGVGIQNAERFLQNCFRIYSVNQQSFAVSEFLYEFGFKDDSVEVILNFVENQAKNQDIEFVSQNVENFSQQLTDLQKFCETQISSLITSILAAQFSLKKLQPELEQKSKKHITDSEKYFSDNLKQFRQAIDSFRQRFVKILELLDIEQRNTQMKQLEKEFILPKTLTLVVFESRTYPKFYPQFVQIEKEFKLFHESLTLRILQETNRSLNVDPYLIKNSDVQKGELIGFGGEAKVYKCTYRGTQAVCKEFSSLSNNDSPKSSSTLEERIAQRKAQSIKDQKGIKRTSSSKGLNVHFESFLKSNAILPYLNHPNIVHYFGYISNPPSLIMEYCPNSVQTLLEESNDYLECFLKYRRLFRENSPKFNPEYLESYGLSFSRIVQILQQLVKGVTFLHSQNIIHRDIKPSNLLISESGDIRIADFGVSKQLASTFSKTNTIAGTFGFMAPEIGSKSHSKTVDIYSIGATAWNLVTNDILLSSNVRLFQKTALEFPQTEVVELRSNSNFQRFILQCLSINPKERPTLSEISSQLDDFETQALLHDQEIQSELQNKLPSTQILDNSPANLSAQIDAIANILKRIENGVVDNDLDQRLKTLLHSELKSQTRVIATTTQESFNQDLQGLKELFSKKISTLNASQENHHQQVLRNFQSLKKITELSLHEIFKAQMIVGFSLKNPSMKIHTKQLNENQSSFWFIVPKDSVKPFELYISIVWNPKHSFKIHSLTDLRIHSVRPCDSSKNYSTQAVSLILPPQLDSNSSLLSTSFNIRSIWDSTKHCIHNLYSGKSPLQFVAKISFIIHMEHCSIPFESEIVVEPVKKTIKNRMKNKYYSTKDWYKDLPPWIQTAVELTASTVFKAVTGL